MRIIEGSYIFVIMTFSISACKSQPNEKIMDSVTRQVVASIRAGHVEEFRSLIGPAPSSLSKDDESIRFDIQQYKEVLDEYIGHDSVHIIITDLYNHLGQRLVKIPIYDYSKDSTNAKELWVHGVKTLFLELEFGPPNLFPINKISGYDLIRNNSDSSSFKPKRYWFPPKET
jgi:hypothetical protein